MSVFNIMKKRHTELGIAFIFIALIIGLTDPIDLLMPSEVQTTLLVLVVVVYGFFAGLMFREKPLDEREELMLHQSSRAGFLVGTGVLLLGVVYQVANRSLDNWLIWALGSMVIVKVVWLYKSR